MNNEIYVIWASDFGGDRWLERAFEKLENANKFANQLRKENDKNTYLVKPLRIEDVF